MALTNTQIVDIRKIIMDNDASDYLLSDSELQEQWNLSFNNIIVMYIRCLERVRGSVADKINLSSQFGDNRDLSTLFDRANALLTYYKAELEKTGYTYVGGTLTPINSSAGISGIGFLDLGIDTDDSDEDFDVWY